tara:strand:+ start:638 stop:1534 length:897 start_codon:yes stop_codon:yes gene_type:complete
MPLQSSGPISFSQIRTEYGGPQVVLSLSAYKRGGVNVPVNIYTGSISSGSAPMSFSHYYNTRKRVPIALAINSNTYNYDIWGVAGLWAGSYAAGFSDFTVTIGNGVLVGSTSTTTYALTISPQFNAGDTVTIINNGVIIGMGGQGHLGKFAGGGTAGAGNAGGYALRLQFPTTIQNNGVIAGGGGGGGGAGGFTQNAGISGWGGGGGGGAGFNIGLAEGGPYQGSNGSTTSGGGPGYGQIYGVPGGAGGGRGAAGAAGSYSFGHMPSYGGAGGRAGYYIVGSNYATWSVVGSRLGLFA